MTDPRDPAARQPGQGDSDPLGTSPVSVTRRGFVVVSSATVASKHAIGSVVASATTTASDTVRFGDGGYGLGGFGGEAVHETPTTTPTPTPSETPTPTPSPVPTATPTPTPTETAPTTPTPTETPDDDLPFFEDQPGFGGVAALVALFSAAVLAMRRADRDG